MRAIATRLLSSADLVAYKALRDEVLTAHPTSFTSDPAPERSAESYRARLGLERATGEFTLGAWIDGGLVGAVSCERDPRPKVRHVGHLIGMMVRPQAQGRGVGQALLEACIALARADDGLLMLTLSVTSDNASAVQLYERAGFTRYGRLPRAIQVDGVYHAKDQMLLDLR